MVVDMATKHLQIELDLDTNNNTLDGYTVHLTPVDVIIPDKAAKLLDQAFSLIDFVDSNPGDGQVDFINRVKIPVKFKVVNVNVNTTLDQPAEISLKIVDRA